MQQLEWREELENIEKARMRMTVEPLRNAARNKRNVDYTLKQAYMSNNGQLQHFCDKLRFLKNWRMKLAK